MIDTIELRVPDVQGLDTVSWPEHTQYRDSAFVVHKDIRSHRDVALTAVTRGNRKDLMVRATLPRLLHGHNAVVLGIDEVFQAIDRLELIVAEAVVGWTLPSIRAWRLSSVDYAHDWRVDSPPAYVAELVRGLKWPGKSSAYFDKGAGTQTAYCKVGGRIYRVYDKEAEVRHQVARGKLNTSALNESPQQIQDAALGLLRFEVRLDLKNLKRAYGASSCTVAGLLDDLERWPRGVVYDEWGALSAGWGSRSEAAALAVLQASALAPARKMALYGIYLASLHQPLGQVFKALGVSDDKARRDRVALAGVGLKTGCSACLPRLLVPPPIDWYVGKVREDDVVLLTA